MGGVAAFALALAIHCGLFMIVLSLGYRIGLRAGQKNATKEMIDLLGSIKIDNWEQSVFRDRFKQALQWVLDGKRKRDRNANPPQANP